MIESEFAGLGRPNGNCEGLEGGPVYKPSAAVQFPEES